MKEQIIKQVKAENDRVKEALELGLISIDPIQFFVDNVDMFLDEIKGA